MLIIELDAIPVSQLLLSKVLEIMLVVSGSCCVFNGLSLVLDRTSNMEDIGVRLLIALSDVTVDAIESCMMVDVPGIPTTIDDVAEVLRVGVAP